MILVLLPPALFATANLVDKFLVHGDEEDAHPMALTALSGAFNAIAAALVTAWVLFSGTAMPNSLDALALAGNGLTFVIAVYLYLTCVRHEEVSVVVPWFQFIPAFGLVGGIMVLAEVPTVTQTVCIVVLVVSGWFLSSSHAHGATAIRMLAASALLATNDVVFAEFGRKMNTSCALACDMWGKVMWCSLALLSSVGRRGFVVGLRTRFKLQSSSEALTISGDAALDVAKMSAPIAIVQAVCCVQPVMTFVLALIVAKWRPDVLREELSGRAWNISVICLMAVAGGYLVYTAEA